MSLLKQQINYLGIGLNLCTFLSGGHLYATEPAIPEEGVEVSRSAPLASHNYLDVAYDVRVYDRIPDRIELYRILVANSSSPAEYRQTLPSCFIEEDWRVTNDVLQTFYTRNMQLPTCFGDRSSEGEMDSLFTGTKFRVDTIKGGGWEAHPNRGDVLFYHWKQAAWVDCDIADQLAQALREGFQDLIPVNPEWAAYWHQRGEILRAQSQWYRPVDTNKE